MPDLLGDATPDAIRDAIRRPLPLAYHPLYRFYEGGSLTRRFRGLPDRPDDWWSEDWVGSCTRAGQRRSRTAGRRACPRSTWTASARSRSARSCRRCPRRWSARPSPDAGGRSPASWSSCCPRRARCRCTPTRRGTGRGATSAPRSARPRRGSCWTPRGTGRSQRTRGSASRPASTGTGSPDAVRRHDNAAIRGTLHRTEVRPGEVYVAHGGRAALPRPADLVHRGPGAHRPDRDPGDRRRRRRGRDHGARLGPGPRHDRLHAPRTPGRRSPAPGSGRGCCAPATARGRCGSSTTTCCRSSTRPRSRSTDEIEVADGRFGIAIVAAGEGAIEGDFGSQPIRRGETYALPASLPFRLRAAGT